MPYAWSYLLTNIMCHISFDIEWLLSNKDN